MFEFLKIVFPIFPGVHLVFLASAVSSKQYDFEILTVLNSHRWPGKTRCTQKIGGKS